MGLFCVQHAETGMVNVINWTECCRDGCSKYPTYGARGSNNREFCAEHALEGMVDVHRKKCAVEGCPKRASHGVRGSGRRQVCGEHASSDMSDVGQKFCRFSSPEEGDCGSTARYGIRGSKRREFCSRHAPDGMVNMNDKLCTHGDCSKLPTYGREGTKVLDKSKRVGAEIKKKNVPHNEKRDLSIFRVAWCSMCFFVCWWLAAVVLRVTCTCSATRAFC